MLTTQNGYISGDDRIHRVRSRAEGEVDLPSLRKVTRGLQLYQSLKSSSTSANFE